jgi:Cu-Zn family superoxide dismutase
MALFGGVILAVTLTAVAVAGRASHAQATLRDAGGSIVGWADFTEDAAGRLHANVHVEGLTSGRHGIHIHAVGSCTPDFAAAGGHHNPTGATAHGLDHPDGPHAGDWPNLVVNGHGNGHLNAWSDRATLSFGPTTIFDADGSALVVHAAPDDQVTQPIGGSGARIACGVITTS